MKKTLHWLLAIVATPVILFCLLALLIYLPPVQNWMVKKAMVMVSEQTGMEVSIGYIRLKWPLDLSIDNVMAIHEGDTIANISTLTADIQLRPLFNDRIVVNRFEINDAKINTNGFISDLQIKGNLEELSASSRGIDLSSHEIQLNDTQLSHARLHVILSDTAQADTTKTDIPWKIAFDSVNINDMRVSLRLPSDTTDIQAYAQQLLAVNGHIDLLSQQYTVERFSWSEGQLEDFGILSMKIDSIDVDTATIRLPRIYLKTPDSEIFSETIFDTNFTNSVDAGDLHLRLNAQLGKQDLLRIANSRFLTSGLVPQKLAERYPNHPLQIIGSADGNLNQLTLTGIDISLPTAFHLNLDGQVSNIMSSDSLTADIRLQANTQDTDFLTTLLPADLMKDYRIPNNLFLNATLRAEGSRYSTDFTLRESSGTVKGQGAFDRQSAGYQADLDISNLNLHHFMPKDSLSLLTASLKINGTGTDLLKPNSTLNAHATISTLKYGHWNLGNMTTKGTLKNGRAQFELDSHNPLLMGNIQLDALLNTGKIQATIGADIREADLYRLRLSGRDELTIGLCGLLEVNSDMKQTHHLSGLIGELSLKTPTNHYHPEDIGLLFNTTPDSTWLRAQSGDLIVKAEGSGGYELLLRQLTTLSDSLQIQFHNRVIDQPRIKSLLPTLHVYVESRTNNPLANILQTKDIQFKEALANLTLSPVSGINGQAHLHALYYDSIRIDTIGLQLTQKGERLSYQAQVTNNRRNPQFVFNALFDGHFTEHGAIAGLRYYDQQGRVGIRLGASANMEADGLRFHLIPERPTIGYKEFVLNADNYIFLGQNQRMQAKVDLIADDKTGIKIYTNEEQDTTNLQEFTLSLNRFNLDELTSVLPYMPHLSGTLNGDFHIVQDQEEHISVVSDMAIHQMKYEGSPIGNLSSEFVYLQREDEGHAVEARLMLDEEEFGLLQGTYYPSGLINASFQMSRLPLSLANGFVPDQIIGLEGYAEGTITIRGTTDKPIVDGEVLLDSAYLVSLPYNIRMRFDNDPVRVEASHLLIENFGLYAYNEEPLVIMGDIDFTNPDDITMDMRMKAQNLLLINARQTPQSEVFGKAFVNVFSVINGPIHSLKMRGRLDVLGSTDLSYMLLDSPLSTDNRMDELVTFTDFNDTIHTVTTRPLPKGFDADLTINVSQGAHVVCNLNAEQTNYLDLLGGGSLRMVYNSTEGIRLNGRYTLSNGEMKYSLPVIPLKTFAIKDGSYVEFTGDPMNPHLQITATERTKALVSTLDGQNRSVAFDCGVVISKTLNDMGLLFVIEAPEDNTVNNELQAMSVEERGKLAVTMLTTGMYMADGNTGNLTMNAALNTFLQSEINNIAGSALKTVDLSIGIENSTDATGESSTDYSFRFAKRFLNNRLKIQIGGLVSTGTSNADMGQHQSFFDNVAMEYRLNQDATKNVTLFYKQNVYDWLEGYTGEYGAGFLWRRKLDSLWDIFTPQTTPTPAP